MNIFFVCTGNTCRSPMAEAIMKAKEMEGVDVRSAGLFAGGGPISAHARTVLTEEGIDSDHRSRSVSSEDIEWATVVLTMTKTHKESLIRSYPGAGHKIYTLKEYVSGSPEDVSDPYGGPESEYRTTFRELQKLLGELERKIRQEQ
ncbi:low molecular weight protein arginine phosphatase [Indiicoccus explosivorum]|uniref:low molecular weight protein arginine phosphatase n=1 Tax=Indiicoccus explosivorum TaxID=1917864 RepID=UPI000B444C1C|nr:low molecular weight protein arginine phosphatase [Indiicoccus explosivorum]